MKSIKVKGKLLQMNFEQCYCQFAPLREKFTMSYSKTLPVDADDIKQEVDIAFYKAYKDYSDLDNEFITLAHKYIISHLTNIVAYHTRPMRKNSYGPDYRLDLDYDDGCLYEETIGEGQFENKLITRMIITDIFNSMSDNKVIAIKNIMNGSSLREIGT